MQLLKTLLLIFVLISRGAFADLTPLAESDCLSDYLDLLKNYEVKVTLAFGYDDIGNNTGDTKSMGIYITQLTGKCAKWSDRMCGFKMTSKPAALPVVLNKIIAGPDGKSRSLTIQLLNPSISKDDNANRTNPEQIVRSKETKDFFLNGLKSSEITFYMGHSRDGGGPSFNPPKLTPDGHVNYDWYHRNKKDKHDMNKALSESPDKTRIIGLLSCSSVRWFSNGVSSNSPKSGFIGTSTDYYAGSFEHGLTVLEKIFSYECLNDLSLPDNRNVAKITTAKPWSVPEQIKKIDKVKIKKDVINNLALQLSDIDTRVRLQAFREIREYDPKLYSDDVIKRMNSYRFSINPLGVTPN